MPFNEPPQAPRLPICAICREPVQLVTANRNHMGTGTEIGYKCHGKWQTDRVDDWDVEAYAARRPELRALFAPSQPPL